MNGRWAFAYNVLLVPTAILSPLIPFLQENAPIFAAAAMALSSVAVVSNSLRLRRFVRGMHLQVNSSIRGQNEMRYRWFQEQILSSVTKLSKYYPPTRQA